MKIVKAKIVKLQTDDDLIHAKADVKIGQEFIVDKDNTVEVELLDMKTETRHKKTLVRDIQNGYLFVELLEFGEEVKLADFIKDSMYDFILEKLDPDKMNKA